MPHKFVKMRPPFDPYKVLHVGRRASKERVEQSFRRLFSEFHPGLVGRGKIATAFEIQEAWELLSDDEYKSWYDAFRYEPPDRSVEYAARYYKRKVWEYIWDKRKRWYGQLQAQRQALEAAGEPIPKPATPAGLMLTGNPVEPKAEPPEPESAPVVAAPAQKPNKQIFRSQEWANKAIRRATEDLQAIETGTKALQERVLVLTNKSKSSQAVLAHIFADIAGKKKELERVSRPAKQVVQWNDVPVIRDIIAKIYRLEEKIVFMEKSLLALQILVTRIEATPKGDEKRRVNKLLRVEASLWGLDRQKRFR
ncbi:hypothetical protein F5Y04DRAFT_276137 [Hypomontagnella monticulosa]|nr:hypothetical protein F5Y04DRAFT_276137 [Hypomontagnella monticulosa]